MKRRTRSKILIGPSFFGERDKLPLLSLIEAGFEVVDNPFKRKLTKSELIELLGKDVSGLIAGIEPIDKEVMQKSNLKVISRCGSGMANVDTEAADDLGIKVYSTPYGPTTAVAELTVGAILSLLRHLPRMNQDMHQYKWNKRIGSQLQDKYVSIIGFGRIGQKVGQLLHAFEAKVVAVDPAFSGKVNSFPVVKLDEALKNADIILLHCSGDKVILGEEEFSLMKRNVYLINAARGEVIDEEELIKALDRGQIAGAWIDTFSKEPYTGPLCRYEQVILTPHVGSYTLECRRQMEMEAAKNLIDGFRETGSDSQTR